MLILATNKCEAQVIMYGNNLIPDEVIVIDVYQGLNMKDGKDVMMWYRGAFIYIQKVV